MFFWKFFEEYEKADHMTDYKTHISMFLIVISQLSICGSFFEKYNKPIIWLITRPIYQDNIFGGASKKNMAIF